MNQAVDIKAIHSSDVPMQSTSVEIWNSKYRLRDRHGNPIDQDITDTFARVARAISEVEGDKADAWYPKFLWALENGAIPAGRITSNAGSSDHKTAVSLINCTVSKTIKDSMADILSSVSDAGLTLKAGCGIGYEFSTIRPRGAYVSGAGASTNGPLAFADIFDKMCFTVSSAGGRRGAQMGTFDIGHPDVEEFITAKREDGRLRQFNLSLLITEDFIQAVRDDGYWELSFPMRLGEHAEAIIYRDWPVIEDEYILDAQGRVACAVYKTVKARDLWDTIMKSTYDFAEPGFILIDKVNEMNNNWWCEEIRATNPCGEQPLPPEGACLLGSINLTKFVIDPFTNTSRFDWERFIEVVKIFTRMLDNVVEINGLPLEGQRREIQEKRRHGMGYLGLGSAMTMLGMKYGDEGSECFTSTLSMHMAIAGWEAGIELAKEKGPAPIMDKTFVVTAKHLRQRPQMAADGHNVGDVLPGRVFFAYSRYMQRIADIRPDIVHAILKYGCRFTHHTSIAPTGTISLSLGNNASNGIEPSFAHSYFRNVIVNGKKSKEQVEVASFELLAYRHFINKDAKVEDLPEYFVTSDNITPADHIKIQAAAQWWIDSSISKTVNVPTDYPFDKFKGLYMDAYASGLKGCTTFRFNPTAFQGVLVKEEDLNATTYVFTLENGETVELTGNEKVVYEGEEHTAANLYDAIKEGYYGKF